MGTSRLQEAARQQLKWIITAWCMIVEHLASPSSEIEIERQLTGGSSFSGPGDFRQWDRWKTGQLPSGTQFAELNRISEQLKWIPTILGRTLRDAYVDRSGVEPADSIRNGWDLMTALSLCEFFAKENLLTELSMHCSNWRLALIGPEEEEEITSTSKFITDNDALFKLIEQIDIKAHLELDISQLLCNAYQLGIEDPFPIILSIIKEHKKEWSNTIEIYKSEEIKNK